MSILELDGFNLICEEYEPKSRLWRFTDHWSGETAKYKMGPFEALVRDYDGNSAMWRVTYKGQTFSGEMPEFRDAIRMAEDKLIELGALHPSATRD